MCILRQWENTLITLLLLLLLSACAGTAIQPTTTRQTAYVIRTDDRLLTQFAPVIIPADTAYPFNKIGTPEAKYTARGMEEIYVNPAMPTVYVQQRSFTSRGQRYTNLIYRMHFERVPLLHLTSGRNGGLIIVITLNRKRQPVLITTVHSCGCYLAFVPTQYLPAAAYPTRWKRSGQRVFGIKLPGKLDYPQGAHPLIFLQHATHRVRDIRVLDEDRLNAHYRRVPVTTAAMQQLHALPLGEKTISFFHTAGPDKGYVKNAYKPFELLLMSWWVLDAHVGMDKDYGDRKKTGAVFYTSLRPWKRRASDMWPFASFLEFWGWRL